MKRSGLGFHLRLSAYWFAASFKWFVLLNGMLAGRVEELVPGGEKSAVWGQIFALGAIEAMIGPIIFGLWSDRLRTRFGQRMPFLAVGALMTTAAIPLVLQAPNLFWLTVGYFLIQVSDDVATAPYSALIPDLVPVEERGRASGIMGFLQLVAQVSVAAVFLAGGGTQVLLWVMVLTNLAGAAIVIFTVKEKPPGERSPWPTLASWLTPLKSADFRWVWFTRFLNALGFYMVLVFLLYALEQWYGLSLSEAKSKQLTIGVVISLTGAFGALVAGRMADKLGRKRVVRLSGYVMGLALVPFAMGLGLATLLPLAVLFGFGYGAYTAADWALVSDVLPEDTEHARDMGLWSMSVPLGQMAAGMIGATVRAETWKGGQGFTLLFLAAGLFFLLSTEMVRQIKGSI